MKLEIWEPPETKEEPEEVLRLRLIPAAFAGEVDLVAVDEGGDTLPAGYILRVQKNGTIRRHIACGAPGIKTQGGVVTVTP